MAWIGLFTQRLGCHGLVFPRGAWTAGAYPVEELSRSAIPDHIRLGMRLTGEREQRSNHQSDSQQREKEPP